MSTFTRPRQTRAVRRLAAVAVFATVSTVATSCGSSGRSASSANTATGSANSAVTAAPTTTTPRDKAGNPSADGTIHLSVAFFDHPDRPQGAVGERFAEEVAKASGGSIVIDMMYDTPDSWDQYRAGTFDMLLTPTRSLDETLGVHSFDVLSLPFVVNDDDQADRVANDPVVETMMAGLSAIGSTGLVFAPVFQRHLSVVGDQPLRRLDQLNGGLRIAPPGDLTDELVSTLGATPHHDLSGPAWEAAVADGSVIAGESSLHLAGILPGPQQVAANFALFYDFTVLMISDAALGKLDAAQVEALKSAAAVAKQRSIDERVRNDDAFRDGCVAGLTFSAAPSTLISEVGLAVDDWVLGKLEDPATKQIYDAVKTAAGAHAVDKPQQCNGGAITAYEPPAPSSATFPEGTYRSQPHGREQLLAAGVDFGTADSNVGWDFAELTFDSGTMALGFHKPEGSTNEECSAPYTVDAEGYLTIDGDCLGGTVLLVDDERGHLARGVPQRRRPSTVRQLGRQHTDLHQHGQRRLTVVGSASAERFVEGKACGDRRAAFPFGADLDLPTEGRKTRAEAGKTAAGNECRTTATVVANRQLGVAAHDRERQLQPGRGGVAGGVGQTLSSGEVQGSRRVGGEPHVSDVDVDRYRLLVGQRHQRGTQPAVEGRRHQAAGQRPYFGQHLEQRGAVVEFVVTEQVERRVDPPDDQAVELEAHLRSGVLVRLADAPLRCGDLAGLSSQHLQGAAVGCQEPQTGAEFGRRSRRIHSGGERHERLAEVVAEVRLERRTCQPRTTNGRPSTSSKSGWPGPRKATSTSTGPPSRMMSDGADLGGPQHPRVGQCNGERPESETGRIHDQTGALVQQVVGSEHAGHDRPQPDRRCGGGGVSPTRSASHGADHDRGQRSESRRCEPARRIGALVVERTATGDGHRRQHGNRRSAPGEQCTDEQSTVGVEQLIGPAAGQVGGDEEP